MDAETPEKLRKEEVPKESKGTLEDD